jgi:pyruvate-formate lyase-activating enzyme
LTNPPTLNHHDNGSWLTALVADERGQIFELEGYAAVGMEGPRLAPLTRDDTAPLPHGSEIMYLPARAPLLYDIQRGVIEIVRDNPYQPGTPLYPVAAFNSPGYVISHHSAYEERSGAGILPLFAYGAVGWGSGGFRSAVIRVDGEPRQDLRCMQLEKVERGVARMRQCLPKNRLRRHLENCALTYGCPAGKNFFLQRYEAPLPTSRSCNARCLGCISLQSGRELVSSQNRIDFTPRPEEIAQVALTHIEKVKNPVVSFGQGCEGDPLLAWEVILPAIEIIRSQTNRGTINMNTNGSLPEIAARLFAAGLDSIRVSLNSVREPLYNAYFRPQGYAFQAVIDTIDLAVGNGRWASVNYLNCPGVSDAPEEKAALETFLRRHPIDMIQWRNLNIDPLRYRQAMAEAGELGPPLGMGLLIETIHKAFPRLRCGYFNPPREKWRRPS